MHALPLVTYPSISSSPSTKNSMKIWFFEQANPSIDYQQRVFKRLSSWEYSIPSTNRFRRRFALSLRTMKGGADNTFVTKTARNYRSLSTRKEIVATHSYSLNICTWISVISLGSSQLLVRELGLTCSQTKVVDLPDRNPRSERWIDGAQKRSRLVRVGKSFYK